MLFPADMRPLLFHEDPDVRAFALEYLYEARDPGLLTADDLWAAADRLQGRARRAVTKFLSSFASTPASTARLFEELRTEPDDLVFDHLCGALARLPGDEVRRALADPTISALIVPVVRAQLDLVVDLAGRSFDDLWSLAETCKVVIMDGLWLRKPSLPWVDRLVDALARFPDQAAARALDVLLDAPRGRPTRWLQAFSARLLGQVRHPGALVPLLAVVGDEAPFLVSSDWAEDALVHLGTREVVAAAVAGLTRGDRFTWHATQILGRIKRSECEQTLVRLLAAASDVPTCTDLGMALCGLCTTSPEALDRLRELVSCRHFDPNRGQLAGALLTVCAVQGFQPVEAPAWREGVAAWEASLDDPSEQ